MICMPAQILGFLTVMVPVVFTAIGFAIGQHWENRR